MTDSESSRLQKPARVQKEYFPEKLPWPRRVLAFCLLGLTRLDLAWSYVFRDDKQVINDLLSLGAYLAQLGDLATARTYFLRAKLAATAKPGFDALIGHAAYNLAEVAFRLEAWDQVIAELEPELPYLRQWTNAALVSGGLRDLGIAFQKMGDSGSAKTLFEESLAMATAAGVEAQRGLAMRCLGGIEYDAKHWDAAVDWWQRSLAVFRKAKDRRGIAMMAFWLGAAQASRGNLDDAVALLDESRALYRSLRLHDLGERAARTRDTVANLLMN